MPLKTFFLMRHELILKSHFSPFLTKLFHSDAAMSSDDDYVKKIGYRLNEIETSVYVCVRERDKPTRS